MHPAPVRGHAVLLRELISNLVHNAIEYTPNGGEVTLRCGQCDGGAYLAIEDNGPGIPPQLREKVFERFYRLPNTTGTGSGLGLAIVKEIALAHDARVSITSLPTGKSTLVTVTFPAPSTN